MLTIAVSCIATAQMQPTAALTIFSEDGYKFYLILNGERQNDKPETNIRVEELVQPYYNAKIIFEDKTKGELSKSYLMVTDADGVRADVTYKIKSGKDGKQSLRYFSSIPIVPNMPPPARPAGVAVYNFGVPTAIIGGTSVTTTTTTTSAPGTSVTVGVPGVSMNVHVNEPVITETHSVTTTTTTTNGVTNMPPPSNAAACYAMAPGNFSALKGSISKTSFDDTKLSTAKSALSSNCMTADQIAQVCRMFSFEENKLNFAKFAYRRCVDPQNYFMLNDVFSFDSSKEDLNNFIGQ